MKLKFYQPYGKRYYCHLLLVGSFWLIGSLSAEAYANESKEGAWTGKMYSKLEKTVTGKITDEDGVTLPGVSVLVKGTTTGTVSDIDGNYSIEVPEGEATLVFSFIGYSTQEMAVGNQSTINIQLKENTAQLEEVVVTGYMTQRKADLTGAIAAVSTEEIEKNSYANVMQGLQGRLAGVYITTDGSPVGNVNVQIRGLTSMRSAPPLVVVDGLPTNLNLRDINSQDIESIQVLKDAASASIYGSRAASGVILIETKKGKEGQTKVMYNGSFGVSSFMNRMDMMNTQEYGATLWQAAINDGQDPNLMTQIYTYDWHTDPNGNAVLDNVAPLEWLNEEQTMPSADTDWFEEGSQLGIQNNQQLSLSHGSERAKTLFSLNYYENQGTQIHTMFRRYSIRLNSEYNLIEDRLTIGENMSLSNIKMNDQNVSHSFMTMPSIVPVYTTDGGWGGSATRLGMDDYNNPVRMLTMNKDNYSYTNKVVGNIYANLTLLKNFAFRASYGIDYGASNYRNLDFTWEEGGGRQDINNGVRSYWGQNMTTTWTNTLTYNLEAENHKLDVLAGMETVEYNFQDLNGYRRDIELENYDYAFLNAATGNQEVNGGGDQWSLLSYFGKFNYVYSDKYLLSATLRYDGSSKFGTNNQFGFFPAVSAGWRLSEENFLKDNDLISDLKLRASWGQNGNSNIPTNALVNFYDAAYFSGHHGTSYGLAGNETGELYSGYRKVHTGNANLRWEATRQTDIGLDFGLMEGALSGSVDYFHKYTDGMLYEPPYLGAIGEGGYRWINAANMTNKGIEAALTYHGHVGKLNYSVTGNISTYRNKIDDLPESVKFTYGGNGLDDDILGRPLNSFYGFIADGLFTTQEEVDNSPEQPGKGLGRIRYRDMNNDGRITWEHDRTWIGVSDPDFIYGLNVDASYGYFDFSMFWQGVKGNTVRNDWKTYSDFWNVWTQQGFNHATRLLGAWTPQNNTSTIPAVSLMNPNDERRLSTYFMESGSYLKLRHIELGYTFPQSLISNLGMQQCRLYVNAQNIVNIKKWWGDDKYTGIDPENPSKANEYSSPYVRPQMFLVGVNVTF
ncbi:SusC/RagA family TonB-linked outer membrane protein [Echinicola rosea]|uniref:SusC/RagA family TonB-linked outer membrane protein n=1 Tax=Echinicola rosea TaxID=1807691 RepID=A0ABQ1US39_9BACT|nr:TonB-dependent receptor [Echinicola rosea]GGF25485.1 SusC/RagA family TonB-linked outer membrane protein [Echinicola rosea]